MLQENFEKLYEKLREQQVYVARYIMRNAHVVISVVLASVTVPYYMRCSYLPHLKRGYGMGRRIRRNCATEAIHNNGSSHCEDSLQNNLIRYWRFCHFLCVYSDKALSQPIKMNYHYLRLPITVSNDVVLRGNKFHYLTSQIRLAPIGYSGHCYTVLIDRCCRTKSPLSVTSYDSREFRLQ